MVDESVWAELLDTVNDLLADIPPNPDSVTDEVYARMQQGADKLESLMKDIS